MLQGNGNDNGNEPAIQENVSAWGAKEPSKQMDARQFPPLVYALSNHFVSHLSHPGRYDCRIDK